MGEYVTLDQTRTLTGDDVDRTVIDEFVKSNYILSTIGWHRAAAATSGSALAYTYTRLVDQADAAFRALNEEYVKSVSTIEQHTVICKTLGGQFGIDRVLAQVGSAAEVSFQMSQKVKGAQARFSDAVINGDADAASGENKNSFDGLSVALTGTDTELDGTVYDWSALADQTDAFGVLDALDALLAELDGSENIAILGNKKSVAKVKQAARLAGYRTASENAAGLLIDRYNNVPIVDLGARAGSNDPIIPVVDGATDLYVVRFGLDGFHAVSPAGAPIVTTRLPNPDSDSVILTGWVEMTATVALKATHAAAVLRGIQVAPAGP